MSNNLSHFIDREAQTAFLQNPIYKSTGSNSESGSFFISATENNRLSCIQGVLTPKIKTWFSSFNDHDIKEELYVTALDNLLKKVDYLHLTMQLDQNLIDEDEFDKELDENEDKYLIKINSDFNNLDLDLVISIVSKLKNRDFTSDEISELFSIDVEKIENFIDHHKKYIL